MRDLNDIYEDLTEWVAQGEVEHGEVLDMFADFIQDTINFKKELFLNTQQIEQFEKCVRALNLAKKIKLGVDE